MPLKRCSWCNNDQIYQDYHDTEWGVAVFEDIKLFEMLLLETFQAGLSWITILKKRENFRQAFDNFDYKIIANYQDDKVEALILNAGIIRNKLKVRAAIINANAFIKIQREFGSFSSYYWSFSDDKVIKNKPKTLKQVPITTYISDLLSKDLKKRGLKFVGSTTIYAFMQATGMANDHTQDCWKYLK